MSRYKVADVMTADVVSVREDTPFHEILDLLRQHGISAVPVVDWANLVVGVISERDLMSKLERTDLGRPRLFDSQRTRDLREKASGELAQELMTSPAILAMPDDSVALTARKMERSGIKRLPVVDVAGRLVGIVSRRDLLRVFLRSDVSITDDVLAELGRIPGVDPDQLTITTVDGTVTVSGAVERRSLAVAVTDRAGAVDGVVDVVTHLTYRSDDSAYMPFVLP